MYPKMTREKSRIPFSTSLTVPSPPTAIRVRRSPRAVISRSQLGGVPLIGGEIHPVFGILLIQYFFGLLPDVFSISRTGSRVYNKIIHAFILLYL